MSDTHDPPRWTLACRDLGFSCEWAVRATAKSEVESRFRDHLKCAHGEPVLSADLARRIADATHPIT